MAKSFLYKLFGFGKVPKKYRPAIEQEGVLIIEEGIPASVTFKNFKAPGRYHSWKRSYFIGALIITEKSFFAFNFSNMLIGRPLSAEKLGALGCNLDGQNLLRVDYDAASFNADWSGQVECRFYTSKAQLFLERLKSVNQ